MSSQRPTSQGSGFNNVAAAANSITLADTTLSSMIKKESQYCDGIKMNHSLLKACTQRLCDVQNMLLQESQGDNTTNDPIQILIEEQKDVIRNIAKENVHREQYVRTFCDTLQSIRTKQQKELSQIQRQTNETDAATQEEKQNNILSFDYKKAIESGMDSLIRKRNINQEEIIVQEHFYREIADILGDPKPTVAATSNKKRANNGSRGRRGSNEPEEEDDDDDIEVMRDTTAATQMGGGVSQQQQQLKCPITREYMTDAVESTVCHHKYSRRGIIESINQMSRSGRTCRCPVVGCTNRNVIESQLQDHYDTSVMAKREVRRQDKRKEQQLANNAAGTVDNEFMDSDEE